MEALLPALAGLFAYPDDGYAERLALVERLAAYHEDAVAEPLAAYIAWARAAGRASLEERFTRTFDLDPTCTLEVGWHLYGEDYNRGAFMARLRDQFADHGIVETIELPDHLTNILPLVAALPVREAASLCDELVLPALAEMRDALIKQESPFAPLAIATIALLQGALGVAEIRAIQRPDKSVPMVFMGKGMRRG